MKRDNIIYLSVFIGILVIGIFLMKTTTSKLNNQIVTKSVSADSDTTTTFSDNGIFKDYYKLANNHLSTLTLDQKIAQLLLVKYNSNDDDIYNYNFGGFLFYEDAFNNKTKATVIKMMDNIQSKGKIPYLIAVDEEGGNVVRISSNTNLVDSPYKSPSEIYTSGGIEALKNDTIIKSRELASLGLNLNLAPVVDISDSNSYIYERTLKENVTRTKEYARAVIESSKGTGVSYTLKHFPGYGNNLDTHDGSVRDNNEYTDIKNNNLPPFESGINAGAEAVLVNHIIYTSIDDENPASLSKDVINLLKNTLKFTGVVISDDLSMGATSSIANVYSKALIAGDDLLIVSNYKDAINDIKTAINNGSLTEEVLNNHVTKILAWKYYKGLMIDKQK